MKEIINILLPGCTFLALFGLAEFCYHKLKWKGEHSRKLVHIGTGLITMLFPILFDDFWSVFILCASFLIILIASIKFNLLKSINDIDRKSYGSVLYPIIICVIFAIYCKLADDQSLVDHQSKFNYFYLPILMMALCDPIAALVGRRWPIGKIKLGNETKTLAGSFGFFCMAVLLCFLFVPMSSNLQSGLPFWMSCFTISITACITELVSKKGIDNFSIPFVVIVLLYLLDYKIFL